ncbi:MAG: prepilin-type N-terminal cleavage/methylation domain-containing protein [Candidatus Magasanikiibacteriota bacterium]
MSARQKRAGFALIEVLVGVAVFVLFAMGIYGGIQFVFKIVYQSRVRILETAILNEQIEIIRNLPFENVGIINGSPAGVLTHTVTTTRNNINFFITRTIRNIDDPFDGIIGGTPNDTVPADYKLIEVEITCGPACKQQVPLTMTTNVSPKLLEGDPTHGALFIEVFDSEIKPVQGATVHIVSTSTDPTIDMTDTTDNDGMLRLLDLGASMDAYNITISKNGYTTDQTLTPTVGNPNPTKQPASVEAQDVQDISFSIDETSVINLSTINQTCNSIGSVAVNMLGTYLIGTEPDVLLINQNINTNGSGNYTWSNLHWDSYGLKVTGYDLLGSIPSLPINLLAGVVQDVQLVLGTNSGDSILVNVLDSITQQPLSGAVVRVNGDGYNQTKNTGVGFVRQTDWSGGSGQYEFNDENKYWSDDGKIENNNPAGDLKLTQVGESYIGDGQLESSVFDLGTAVNFVNINWEPMSQPIETGANSVRWQIATSNTSSPASWDYFGPDGTGGTYYNSEEFSINAVNNNSQFLRYKVYLNTDISTSTPTVSDVTISYTTSCTPPGQSYFGSLTNGQVYTVEVSRDGYQDYSGSITASGDLIQAVDMVAE